MLNPEACDPTEKAIKNIQVISAVQNLRGIIYHRQRPSPRFFNKDQTAAFNLILPDFSAVPSRGISQPTQKP